MVAALAVLAAAVVGLAVWSAIATDRMWRVQAEAQRDAWRAQADAAVRNHEASIAQVAAMRDAVTTSAEQTSKAIGHAVQAAMSGPPAEPPRQTQKVWRYDSDVADGTVDDSDPTDAFRWLAPERRDEVAMLAEGESPIPGVELRP